jgi:hypothetical protein
MVIADGRQIASVPLLLAKALPAVSSVTLAAEFLTRPSTLFVLVLLVATAAGARMFWRRRSRALAAGTRR